MSQTNPQGSTTLGAAFSRVANKCAEVQNVNVQDGSILANLQHAMLHVFASAQAALAQNYLATKQKTVTSGQISIAASDNYYDVLAITFGAVGSMREYDKAKSKKHFARIQRDYEHQTVARYWWYEKNDRKLYVFQGSACNTETTLDLLVVEYPYVGFTIADVEAGTIKIDMPDYLIPLVCAKAAYDALLDIRNQVSQDARENMDVVLQSLNKEIASERQLLGQEHKETM